MPLDVHPSIPMVPEALTYRTHRLLCKTTAYWDQSTTAQLAIVSMAWEKTSYGHAGRHTERHWDTTWYSGGGRDDDDNDDDGDVLL